MTRVDFLLVFFYSLSTDTVMPSVKERNLNMVDISFQQYKMLKCISKQNTISTHFLSLEQRDICEFLCSKNFLLISKKERLNPDGEISLGFIQLSTLLLKLVRLKSQLMKLPSTNGGFLS